MTPETPRELENRSGLPVNSHHFAAQGRQHAAHPAPESLLELAGIDQAKDPAKGVVRGNAVLQTKMAPEPVQLLVGPQFDLFKGAGPHQDFVDRRHQQLCKSCLILPG